MSRPRRIAACGVAAGALRAGVLLVALPAPLAAQGPPNPPINLEADVRSDRVDLTWEVDDSGNRSDPLFFRVYRDGSVIGNSFDQEHTDSDVEIAETYTYEVSGVDVLGREGGRSTSLTVTIPSAEPPRKPQNLTAEAVSPSRIDLRWDAVGVDDDDDGDDGRAPVEGYYIYRDGSNTPHDSTGATAYSDTGLAPFTEYSYRVSAVDVTGSEGDKSDGASARTLDGSPPTAPANLAAEAKSSSEIELSWSAAVDPESGIEEYQIYRDGGSEPIASTSSTSHKDTGLSAGVEHTYEVAAVNGAGVEGPRSNPASARTSDDTPPTAPAGLSAQAAGARLIELSWSAASDPESGISIYLVYRDGDGASVDSTTSTTYADGSVEPETTYSYRVSARNGAGLEGPQSAAADATTPAATDATPPSVPGGFTAEATGPDRVELSWSAAEDPESGVSSYRVYRDGAQLGTSPGVGFADLTVAPETTYEYEVSAVNGDGLEGPRTDAVAVTTPGTEDTVPPAPPTNLRVVTE